MLDNRYRVETPEGIDLLLRPAGLVPRALAFTVDLALRGLILLALFFGFGLLGKLGIGSVRCACFSFSGGTWCCSRCSTRAAPPVSSG